MAGTTVSEILSGRVLSGVINKVAGGLPTSGIPEALVNPPAGSPMLRQVLGDSATFITYRGTRKGVQRSERDAPSKDRAQIGIGEQSIKLISFKNNLTIKSDTFRMLKSTDTMVQDIGKKEIQRQVTSARQEVDNGRVMALSSALSLGTISYDVDGAILSSTSNAVLTVDLGVPAANKSQVALGASSANLVTESWANSTAKIGRHLIDIKAAIRRVCGHNLTGAMYGANVMQAILDSNYGDQMISANNAYQKSFAEGVIPDGFGGIAKWMPAYEQFWSNDSDTLVQPFNANAITLIPDPAAGWYELTQGTTTIPKNMRVAADVEQIMADSDDAPGKYAYAYMPNPDPVVAKMVYGDCYLPWFTTPEAVVIATVIF